MNTIRKALILVILISCSISGWAKTNPAQDVLFQFSTLSALQAGILDGELTCKELKSHGNFGIGTFTGLGGEMVLLDGKINQITSDGKVLSIDDAANVPFALATYFEPDKTLSVDTELNFAQLLQNIDSQFSSKNIFYAIKITGTFATVKTRSVPKQNRPYPTLAEVVKKQVIFEGTNVKGTVVGFWAPSFVNGINLAGYHLHFIADDRSIGGHLFDCKLTKATITIDETPALQFVLPNNPDFRNANLDVSVDKSLEVAGKDKK